MSSDVTQHSPRPIGLPPVAVSAVLASSPAVQLVAPESHHDDRRLPSAVDIALSGITLRSHDVQHGDLFVALSGSRAHGATYAAAAIQSGAKAIFTDQAGAAIVAQQGIDARVPVLVHDNPRDVVGDIAAEIYHHPSRTLSIIGITGTAGKTTTCYLLVAALHALDIRTGLIGTVETRIGDTVVPSALTTPEAPDLQALFATMLQQGVQTVAMEVSSHALALGRVSGTDFAVGAFTNLSLDHLDFHGDMEHYFAAKSLLFDGRAAYEIIVIDDEYGRRLAESRPSAATISTTDAVPTGLEAAWHAAGRDIADSAQQLHLTGPEGLDLTAQIDLPGSFNIANAATALVAISALGHDPDRAAAGLAHAHVPGRMERVNGGQPFTAIVDYAHKPEALRAILTAARRPSTARVIAVIGAGGDRDRGKRPIMGQIAAQLADIVIITDDNPRSEDPAVIRGEIMRGAEQVEHTAVLHDDGDRRGAIQRAIDMAEAGDVVVVAGKGHETGQESHGETRPFSDRDEIVAALARRGWSA